MQSDYQVAVLKTTIWVPIDKQGISMLGKIAPKESFGECHKLLRQHPGSLDHDRWFRVVEVTRLLKDKTLPALFETVRDLTAHSRQKLLGVTENELLKKLSRRSVLNGRHRMV